VTSAIRSFLTLVLAASVALGLAGTGAAYAEPSARPTASAAVAGARVVDHSGDLHRSAATDASRRTKKKHKHKHARAHLWKQRNLYYYESLPSKWDWSLSTAVAKWNASGAKIRFVKVLNRRKARLTISYGAIVSRAGEATVGPLAHPWVRLSNYYRHVDGNEAADRVEVMAVLAHELGHVLGFQHSRTRCSLMSPVLDVVGCGMVKPTTPGYYRCRVVSLPLVTRLVREYGGRSRVPTGSCLIDPMPPALQHVSFSGGESSEVPVTVNWAVPSATPPGSTVEIHTWAADSCGAPPAWASVSYAPVSSSSWRADEAQAGEQCMSVELVNRYGVGRQPIAGRIVAPGVAGDQASASSAG
jgi:hypothetical protein